MNQFLKETNSMKKYRNRVDSKKISKIINKSFNQYKINKKK